MPWRGLIALTVVIIAFVIHPVLFALAIVVVAFCFAEWSSTAKKIPLREIG
jgi:hypothetical protein